MEQQATNAALAALAKNGDSFALGQLWEINKGLLRSLFLEMVSGAQDPGGRARPDRRRL